MVLEWNQNETYRQSSQQITGNLNSVGTKTFTINISFESQEFSDSNFNTSFTKTITVIDGTIGTVSLEDNGFGMVKNGFLM